MILTRLAVIYGLVAVGFAQSDRTPTASELLAASLSELRGASEGQIPGFTPPNPFAPPVQVFSTTQPVFRKPITLPPISLTRLQHKVPGAAKKAYDKATSLVLKGQFGSALEEYRRAIVLDPDYLAAHCDLGVRYHGMKRYAEAAAEFRKAVALFPESADMHSNLGWSLLALGETKEAENSVRQALQLSNANLRAHWLLGHILAIEPSTQTEAIEHLDYALRLALAGSSPSLPH